MTKDRIDWSKAGTRLRHTPRGPTGNNPDWNFVERRWKTAEEYAGEELTAEQVVELVYCPRTDCAGSLEGPCTDARGVAMDAPHTERRVAAGQSRIFLGQFAL